jgi:shikimate kinase
MKSPKVFLLIGASGVGKTTTANHLHANGVNYTSVDMDAEIVKRFGDPNQEVTDYFQAVGMEAFQENVIEILKGYYGKDWSNPSREILLVDIGAGSIYGSQWEFFTEEFHTVLLTAYPEYLWNTRTKPAEIHKNFNHFMTWQFNVPKMLHETCDIVMDVSYLSVKEVADGLDKKITNYIKSKKLKKVDE